MDTHALRQALEEKRANGEVVVCTNPAQKARHIVSQGKKLSAHQAIKAKCWECMGGTADEWDSDTRKSIRECSCGPESCIPCSLYEFRPYK